MTLNKKSKGGGPSHKTAKTASLLVLTVVFAMILCGAVSAADDNNTALNTTHSGTVSGGLYVNATQPVAWGNQPGQSSSTSSREFNQTFNLPTNSSLNGSDIQWAEVYVNIYSGTGSGNWPLNATILLDGNGDGVYETTLDNILLTSTSYSTDGTIYWLKNSDGTTNDHCFRVYSDYQLWYNLTGLITSTHPSIYVKTEQVGTNTFDGRLKMITLVAAYNDGDTDKIDYWVNDGQDWISSGHTSSTTFNTSTVTTTATNATLNTVILSSKDGTYTFNNTTYTGTDPVTPINYLVTHTWDVTNQITPETNSTLNYTAGNSSFKSVLTTLTIKEKATIPPEANFTTDKTSGTAPLTVNFTDTSTNATSWNWDFDNNGTTDSTQQNPTYTYNNPGTYTIKLTVTGPGGTNTTTKNNYIAVIPTNYITYLGGSGGDLGMKITVDSSGNMYITGYTASTDFPTTTGAYQTSNAGGNDAFLSKFNSSGNLIYSTYLGGSGDENGNSIAVDSVGNIYITGSTKSTNFPTTSGAYQTTYGGGNNDAFLSKFNSNGNLVYSTYLGGSGDNDIGRAITLDNDGNIYITGSTASTNFPTTTDAYQKTLSGSNDVFLSKFNSSGNLVYSTYLGGSSADNPSGISVDSAGNIYITGYTGSTNFPTTSNAYQITKATGNDAFLAKFNSSGNLVYSTYLGGTASDYGYGVAVDSAGNIYITGYTTSTNFPTTSNAYQTSRSLNSDAFLAKFNSSGNLVYSTYLGGTGSDYGYGVAVDSAGNIYIIGFTNGNFPITTGAYQTIYGGGTYDAFLSEFNSSGNLVYSTYLGGSAIEYGYGIALDNAGNIYITGNTGSSNFPTTTGAYQTSNAGSTDAFLAKINTGVVIVVPMADFSVNNTTVFTNKTVQFTDKSTGATSWAWDFNNDGVVDSTVQNPSWIYTTAGTYTVKLTVSNSAGSDDEVKTDYITAVTDTQVPTVTATPVGGTLTNTTQVTLSATDNYDTNPKIYYTTDNTDPTTSSTLYTNPISIIKTTTLKFIAVDAAGNISPVQSETYTDNQAPTTTANPVGGTLTNTTQVTLSATDNYDTNPKIYYTTDNTDPTTGSTLYTSPISILKTTTLKFMAVDASENTSQVQTETYIINDTQAPTVTVNPVGGTYSSKTQVTLTATDNIDPNPVIYYTLDGSTPTTNSTQYTGPFYIPTSTTTTLKFMAVDATGNTSPVQTEVYNMVPDLSISNVSVTTYPLYYNKVTGTIQNSNGADTGAFNVTVQIGGYTSTVNIPGLAMGGSTTFTVTDNTQHHVGDILPVTITVDPENAIVETNKSNNLYTTNAAIATTGNLYDGGRFSVGQDLVNTSVYEAGNIGVAVAISGGYGNAYDVPGVTLNRTFSASDLNIPAGATILSARLYQGWSWYGDPGFVLQFNGNETQEAVAKYKDNINGQYVFDITPYFNSTGDNSAILTSTKTTYNNKYAFYGTYIIVVYEDANQPYRQIWVNEGSDCLLYGSDDPVASYTVIQNASTTKVASAQLTTIYQSGDGDDGNNVALNGQTFHPTGTGGSDPEFLYFNVTPALQNGTNEIKVFGGSSYFNYSASILTLTYDLTAPNVTATPTSGTYTSKTNVTLSATDNLDTNPKIYYTTDGSDPTANSTPYTVPISIPVTTTLKFIAVDASGNTSAVRTETYTVNDTEAPSVTASQSGVTITISATDNMDPNPKIYYTTDGTEPTTNSTLYAGSFTIPREEYTVVKFFAVDASGNTSPVQNKTYTGYITTDLLTGYYAEGNIGIVISNGGTFYRWFEGPGTVTYKDLNIPEGATILAARLYQAWTWYGCPGYTLQFNGHSVNQTAHYQESEGASVGDGQDVFDVTPYFNATGDNTATITSGAGANYATILIVVYQSASEPYRKIWINEGYNILYYGGEIGYAFFNNVTTNQVASAQITTITPSGGGDTGSIRFNGQTININGGGGSDPNFSYYNVTSALKSGFNELEAYGGSYMSLATAILTLTIDTTPPTVTTDTPSGLYNTTKNVTLTATDDQDTHPLIYYTLDGSTPTTNSTLYTSPIGISSTTTLEFIAVDDTGNMSPVQSETYTIDTAAPNVTASLASGIYSPNKTVTLSATDNLDTQPKIYYTLDGTDPTTSSTLYTGPISINSTCTLKFIAADSAGNVSPVQCETYTIVKYDFTVTSVDSQQSVVFAGESNMVSVTVKNNGADTATNIVVNLYASDVNNGTTVVASTTIGSLAGGASTTVTLVDPTIRPITSNTTNGSSLSYVNYTATTDPDNNIPETNETNNSLTSTALGIYYNGYKGKRYEYNGEDASSSETNTSGDINTEHVYDLKGGVIYSSGNSSYHGAGWTTSNTTWTSNDLNIPTTGSLVDAWLYVSYNWDTTSDGDPNWTVTFNGVEISPVSWYYDQKNFGTNYSTYRYGLYVYNVANLLKTTGNNTLAINALTGNNNALYPSTLVVVYSDPTQTRKQIFINEQCDELLMSSNYGVTLDEATAYAPFTGLEIDTSKVLNATLYSFAGSAGPNEGNLLWNNTTLATNAWQGNSNTASPLIYNVTNYLTTDNVAGIQETQSGGMAALQQILVIEYDTIPPTVTANPASGYYNTDQNVTLIATDNHDTQPLIYYTTNGQTPTTKSTQYTGPITISSNTTLKYIAADNAGNISPVQSATYTMDTTAPHVTADIHGGLYNTTQNVTLTATDNLDTQPTIYYTLNGDTPTTSSTQYTGPITIDTTTTLKYIAVDSAGNLSNVQTEFYTIDKEAPNTTANPTSGLYNNTQNIVLTTTDNLDTNPNIYYTLDGTTPTNSSNLYTGPINIASTTVLKFIAVDDAGNMSPVQSVTYTIDTQAPTVTADLKSGSYNTTKTVTLSATDNLDTQPDIYYTTDGSTPTTTSTLYNGPISITANTTLKYMAVDDAGNLSDIQTEVYIIDTVPPTVSASADSGIFGKPQNITLTSTDNEDTNPTIYYTLDGSTPTTTSTLYTGPISIGVTTVLKFFAVDDAGNASPVQSKTYTIDTQAPNVTSNPTSGIYNTSKTITLTATDNITANPSIYYTLDGTDPTTTSTQYTGPITIDTTTTLQFIAVDIFGNTSPVQTETYTIDTVAPTVAADIHGGLYNTNKTVTLTAADNLDTNPSIYYTLDGTTPTTTSTLYTGPITLDATTTLKFIAVDDAGNLSGVQSEFYTIDKEAPSVIADPKNVSFNTSKTITLSATDNLDTQPSIYYTLDGTVPTMSSTLYTGPITLDVTSTLKFFAVDDAGNVSGVQSETYILDTVAPTVNSSMGSGMVGGGEIVALNATDNTDNQPDIYYTTDGTDPTTSSTQYTGPISLGASMVLKFFAVDEAGNASPTESRTYTVDTTAPTVTASPASGIYNTTSVVLSATDNLDANPTIYYTTDGTDPTNTSTIYTGPISINANTTLKYIAADILGNTSNVQSATYTIDTTKPTTTAGIHSGLYNTAQKITLTATDNLDNQPDIYYTLDGTTPTITNKLYTNPININKTTTLKFIAFDSAGNSSGVQTEIYSIDTVKPLVKSVDPANNTIINNTSKKITITFTEAIKNGTGSIILKNSKGTKITIKTTLKNNQLTITPTKTLTNNIYTLLLSTGSITDTAGNKIAAYTSKFTIDTIKPTVRKIDPTNKTTINKTKKITITFTEAIKKGTGLIKLQKNGTQITIKTLITGNTLTITPTKALTNGTYQILLNTGSLTDQANNLLAAYTSYFTIKT